MGLPLSDAAVTIRRAVAADAERLTAIAHAAKRHWGYSDDLIRLWAHDLTVTSATIAQDIVYCAVHGSAIVGLYAMSRETSAGDLELEHMWVAPEAIGSGVGAALFRHAAAIARAAGSTLLRIASDPNAEGFYLRMGATRVGAQPTLPEGRALPLLVLRLDD